MTRLNFPRYDFRLREREGCRYIWDRLRKAWLVLTPEEWVRRNLVEWLLSDMGVDKGHIVQEHTLCIGRKPFRADVVCFDASLRPLLLAECKAPEVTIDRAALEQAVKYNSVLEARYVMLTNGLTHYFLEKTDTGEYRQLKELPLIGVDKL